MMTLKVPTVKLASVLNKNGDDSRHRMRYMVTFVCQIYGTITSKLIYQIAVQCASRHSPLPFVVRIYQWSIKCQQLKQIRTMSRNRVERVWILGRGQNSNGEPQNNRYNSDADYYTWKLCGLSFDLYFAIKIADIFSFALAQSTEDTATKAVPESEKGRFKYGCPLDKDELGRSTWNLLHTMAATYPEKPSTTQSADIVSFFNVLSRSYPCDICAKDLVVE